MIMIILVVDAYQQGALDHKGRSPLAICLECKENDWKKTEQLLREHLQEQVIPSVQIIMNNL